MEKGYYKIECKILYICMIHFSSFKGNFLNTSFISNALKEQNMNNPRRQPGVCWYKALQLWRS
jgi:hypothetical protein